MTFLRKIVGLVAIVALCAGALWVGCLMRGVLPGLSAGPALAQDEAPAEEAAPEARAQMVTEEGRVSGRVVVGAQTVIETTSTLDGLGPYERASIASARINLALEEGAGPADFEAITRDDRWMVVSGDRIIISVAPTEGDQTEEDTARRWTTNIQLALHEAFGTSPGAEAPIPPARVEAREEVVEGGREGVVLINGEETIRIVASAPGLTPFERAQIVADRVQSALDAGALPQDVHAEQLYGMSIVKVKETLLITVAPDDAQAANNTPEEQAEAWATALSEALAAHYGQATDPSELANQQWQPREPYDDKWVPIISVLEGVRIGLARVNGPSSKVRTVQAVAQLETHWKRNLEIDVFVPISTKVPGKTIDWVKGCAVTGLADIRL